MVKKAILCGQCIALLKEHYRVTELYGMKKNTCDNCGKRRYGTRCRIESANVKEDTYEKSQKTY